ncbi:MAG: regulatory protein RecX [Paludibacteraceae bacterium]|nr:regulatory protein RecX [Paludibacteraceae bacterium]
MNFNEALQKAAAYCSLSEKCEYEVKEKLRTWDVSNTDVAKVIDQLRHDDFINDARYCTYYTRDKFRFNRWGKIKIGMMLRSKQLPEEEITNALAQIDEAEYEEALVVILQTKLKSLTYKYEYEKQGKLFRFAQSRGFEHNIVSHVLRQLE